MFSLQMHFQWFWCDYFKISNQKIAFFSSIKSIIGKHTDLNTAHVCLFVVIKTHLLVFFLFSAFCHHQKAVLT